MKREFLRELGLDKETEDKIMAEYGKDIQAEKAEQTRIQNEIDEAQKTIETYKTQVEELKKTVGDNTDAAKKLKELQDRIAEEKRQAEEKAADEQLTNTIRAALPQDKKFVNEYTETAMIAQIKAELNKAENKGKGISDIFGALTKDKPGIFANPNEIKPLPPMGDPEEPEGSNEAAMRRIFGLEKKEK
ncbi:MAG: phage scaffolding protein [Clostridia bacterium]|nr:phage scaffolding protein [Clostridia bacterium]